MPVSFGTFRFSIQCLLNLRMTCCLFQDSRLRVHVVIRVDQMFDLHFLFSKCQVSHEIRPVPVLPAFICLPVLRDLPFDKRRQINIREARKSMFLRNRLLLFIQHEKGFQIPLFLSRAPRFKSER